MKYIVKRSNETLDQIVYNNYGSSFGYLEQVLKANSFLYKQSYYLKKGLEIELPEITKERQSRLKLWN